MALPEFLSDAAPEIVGGLLVAAVVGAAGVLRARAARHRSKPKPARRLDDIVPKSVRQRFQFDELCARTDDDEAGLTTIAHLIQEHARSQIEVIGRGTHWVESRTAIYVSAVARAILRGVSYTRILIIDEDLPENGLTWLLLLERFIAQPQYSGVVRIYPINARGATDMAAQFQLIDRMLLHRTNRMYAGGAGASGKAQSTFAVTPHPDVASHVALFERYLSQQARTPDHDDLALQVEQLLATIDRRSFRVVFHWKVALDVLRFLDTLRDPVLPPRGFDLVGSLTPFTFSYEAAATFTAMRRDRTDARPALVIPFERLDDAVDAFKRGSIDHVCVPTSNTRVDHLRPPHLDDQTIAELDTFPRSGTLDRDVAFVLAGAGERLSTAARLAAVGAARAQVETQLSRRVRELPGPDQEVDSNYHAAWLAAENRDVVAVTTRGAAEFFGLRVYKSLTSGVTTFTVYSRSVQ